jgi:hypothetical protein
MGSHISRDDLDDMAETFAKSGSANFILGGVCVGVCALLLGVRGGFIS